MKKMILTAIGCLTLLTGLCCFNALVVNPKQLHARTETISSGKIDEDIDGLIVAYFADLHYGTYVDMEFVNKCVEMINDYDPDIIIFGGDLADDSLNEKEKEALTNAFSKLSAPYGKYAVCGEYDYNGSNINENIYDVLTNSGFTILNNSNAKAYIDSNSYINIVGIDSVVSANPLNAFDGVNSGTYTFAIAHYPDTFDSIMAYDFDYCLAGHSHGGQVYFPIINLINRPIGCQAYYKGKTNRNGKTLDITNGVGRTESNARLNADAEIVIYRLDYVNYEITKE